MPENLFQFEDFVLDRGAYELRRGGVVVPLQRIPLELLMLLVERRGQLVTREEILDRVERFVWSHPEVTVLSMQRHWLEPDR